MTINFDPNEQTTSDEGGSEARQADHVLSWSSLHGNRPWKEARGCVLE